MLKENNWQLIYIKSKSEKKTAELLSQINIEYLLPIRNELRKWGKRKKMVEVPLFPSYIFVKVCDASDYIRIMNLETVAYFVKIGKKVATIPVSVIDSIKSLLDTNYAYNIVTEKIKLGKMYQISKGPLSGFNCEVVSFDKKDMILVRIDILNRGLLIDLSYDLLLA